MPRHLLAALLLGILAIPAAAQDSAPRTLSVSGTGTVSAAPDMAHATFGVEARRPEAAAAAAAAAGAMTAVIARLRDAGIAGRDIRTVEIGLNPVYSRPDSTAPLILEGYVATHRVVATVRALDRLGAVFDAAIGAGATDFGGVSFDIAARAALEDDARRAAVADAARIAGLLAEAAGVRLGAPQSIGVGGVSPVPMAEMRAMRMEAAGTPVAAGDMAVSATVAVVYAIE